MASIQTIRVVTAAIEQDGRYLITQRRPNAVLPLLWELPGGKVEPSETDAAALRRELRYRLGIDVEPGHLVSSVTQPYEGYVVDLYVYECRILTGTIEPRAVNTFKWITSAEIDLYELTPADEASLRTLVGPG